MPSLPKWGRLETVTILWYLKNCVRCGCDLAREEDSWRCGQCGHYYYLPSPHPVEPPLEPRPAGTPGRVRRRTHGGMVGRNINAVIHSRRRSRERWWADNRQIIAYLDEGHSVREIAALTLRGQRQIRTVRERLAGLKAQSEV